MHLSLSRIVVVIAIVPLLFFAACAKAPTSSGTGVRLVVTMRFNGPVRDIYHYYFVIRNAGDDIGRNGPVPVIEPPYGGNGFAASKSTSDGTPAFTDFVHYNRSNQQVITSSGYTLYHVPGGYGGNPAINVFQFKGEPISTTSPSGGNTLQFELGLDQIAPNTGETAPSPDSRPRYLQINIIAASTSPANSPVIDSDYFVDAMGDQRSGPLGTGFSTFLTIDTGQIGKLYESRTLPGPDEPISDTWPSDRDPAVELVYWSIQVVSR